MKKVLLFLAVFICLTSAAMAQSEDDVIFNEIFNDGMGAPNQEAVELLVVTPGGINMGGWVLTDDSKTGTAEGRLQFNAAVAPFNAVIPQGTYIIIAVNNTIANAILGAEDTDASDRRLVLYRNGAYFTNLGNANGLEFANNNESVALIAGNGVNDQVIDVVDMSGGGADLTSMTGGTGSATATADLNIGNGDFARFTPFGATPGVASFQFNEPAGRWTVAAGGLANGTPGATNLGVNDSALPVELTAFNGSLAGQSISLTWVTASEQENRGFILLRDGAVLASHTTAPALQGRGTIASATSYSYVDATVETGRTYTYLLRSEDLSGVLHDYPIIVTVEVRDGSTAAPTAYRLEQNYPNPFNPSTVIRFSMKEAGTAALTVFDVTGRLIVREKLSASAGANQYRFDGSALTSGVYFYTLVSGTFQQTRRMVIVK